MPRIDPLAREASHAAARLVGLAAAAACQQDESAFAACFAGLPPAVSDQLGLAVIAVLQSHYPGGSQWAWGSQRTPWAYKTARIEMSDAPSPETLRAIESAIKAIHDATPGIKLDALGRSSYRISRLVRDGRIGEVPAVERLYAAAIAAGFSKADATEVIKAAFYDRYQPRSRPEAAAAAR